MPDHYQTLGVAKTATQDEIKRAYRSLASKHHPDKGGDTAKFQEIQTAYDTLGDADKRAAYDNPAPQFGDFGGFNGHPQFNDIFAQMFGGQFGQHPRRNHVRMSLWVRLRDVADGGKRAVGIGNQTVEIDVPLGLNDGDNVQYPGIAPNGQDLVISYRIHPDPVWSRNGLSLTRDAKISVWDLILGSDLEVENIYGHTLTVRVPSKTQPGTQLRLRDQGLRDRQGRKGDMMVRLIAQIPDTVSQELVEAIQKYR